MKLKNYFLFIVGSVMILVIISLSITEYDLYEPNVYQLALLGAPNPSLEQVHKFSLEVKLDNGDKIKMRFHDQEEEKDDIAKIYRRTGENIDEFVGEEAEIEINNLVRQMPHPNNVEPLELVAATLKNLKINQRDVRDFEMKMHLITGKEVRIAIDVDIKND